VYRDKGLVNLDATIEARERSEVDLGGMFVDCDELEDLEDLEELEDFDFRFEIDEAQIRESVERATEYLRSPEFRDQWKWVEQWDEEELEDKLEEMEEKLEEMEKELKKLEKERDKKKEKL
jgi:septin family protein